MNHVARVLNLPGQGFQAVLAWILEFRKALGVPSSLADWAFVKKTPTHCGRRGGRPDGRLQPASSLASRVGEAHSGGHTRRYWRLIVTRPLRLLVAEGDTSEARSRMAAEAGETPGEG